MTAADLLARLAQRPPRECEHWRNEFDRALLLDWHAAMTEATQNDDEAAAYELWQALRTIVATLRETP